MRLCQYHRDELKSHLRRAGVPELKHFHAAESLLIDNALQAEPMLAEALASTCHICRLMKPSWLRLAALSISESKEQI